MEDFYEMDLTKLDYGIIPDGFFDLITISHVIEHLYNGSHVIEHLLPKLKKGGIIYLEWPGISSYKFPKMRDTLNFFDDSTHICIYTLKEIYNLLLKNNMAYCDGGKRRYWKYIILSPALIIRGIIQKGYVSSIAFWDIMGFAEYAIFKNRKLNIILYEI